MWRDLRNAARALARTPTFTLAAMLALALGIGANGAIFGLVDALWLRPPGVRTPGTLVRIFATTSAERDATWSWPEFEDVKARATVFEDVAVRGRRGATMTAQDGSQELLLANVVSINFFEMLGITPAAGRLFAPGDAAWLDAEPSVVLGYAFWQSHFGGDPGIIGQTVQLGRGRARAVTVMGVLPRTFRDLEASADRDVWLPPQAWTRIGASAAEFQARDNRWFEMIARRRPDVPVETASAEMATLAASLAAAYPATSAGRGARVVGDLAYRLERSGGAARAMLALVLLVVLISCVNVANLLLARAASRARELAVRLALGAPRWRLIRELASESLILGTLGAAGGLLAASWLIGLLPALMSAPPGMREMTSFQTDARVVLFTAAVAAITTVLFGLAPAGLAARADFVTVMKRGSGASPRGGAVKRVLVVTQVAISLVLLCVAGDLARSFAATARADIGFARKPLLTLWTTFSSEDRATAAEAARQLQSLPGVRAVALAVRAPLSLSGGGLARPVIVPGVREDAAAGVPRVKFNAVSSNYFEVFGTRILRGRPFSTDEEQRGDATVVINEQFARQFFTGRDPLGVTIGVAGVPHRIVGIAQDGVANEIGEAPQAYMYLPFRHGSYGETTFILETTGDAALAAAAARAALRRVHSSLEPRRLVTMERYVSYATSLHRTTAALASILALVGLLLTAVGVYGVVAYRTTGRAAEIGIRMALGALDRQVMQLIIGDGLRLGLIGIAAGLPLALGATHLVASMLLGVKPWDVPSFASAAAMLLLAVSLATLIPARRATRVEPSSVLRRAAN